MLCWAAVACATPRRLSSRAPARGPQRAGQSSTFIGRPPPRMAPRLGRVSLTPPAALLDEAPLAPVDKAVVWFRVGDLRLRDHPGLSSAATSTTESVAPLFVVTPATPACVIPAVERLRADLRSRGSDLYVRFADTERQGLVDFVLRDHRCGRVLARRDVDARALDDVQWIQEQLLAQPAEVEFVFWREGLWHIPGDSLQHVPESYPEFLAWRSSATPAPPCVAADIAGLRVSAGRGDEAGVPAKHVRVGELAGVWSQREASARQSSVDAIEEAYVEDSARLGVPNVADVRRDADAESLVVRLLERLEAHEAVDVARALQPVLWLGLTSPRRIRDVCVKFERDRGRLWPPVYRLGAKTVLRYLDAREFADCSAERDLANEHVLVGEHRPKFYRWRGYLTRYVEAGDTPATRLKPAVVLVHGFGASAQHWNRPIALLAPNFHCFAFCNIGFGRAEKPPFVYTQHLWELFLASFVRDVVRRKSFVAGNSIGGYLAAAFACDAASDLCAGLALVNSAGTICSAEEFAERQEAERRQVETGVTVPEKRGLVATALRESRSLRFAACNLLLLYLRRGIGGTLRRVYPTAPEGWTDDLAREIHRNSMDCGAVDVIASGFVLPPQRPLNELLADASGPPVLVFQGRLDPLGSSGRAEKFRRIIPAGRDAVVEVIEAGHCPHDECPALFCDTLTAWMCRISARDADAATATPQREPCSDLVR